MLRAILENPFSISMALDGDFTLADLEAKRGDPGWTVGLSLTHLACFGPSLLEAFNLDLGPWTLDHLPWTFNL